MLTKNDSMHTVKNIQAEENFKIKSELERGGLVDWNWTQ
jgi:hypothetical protein